MKRICLLGSMLAVSVALGASATEGMSPADARAPIPATLFGQNIEHCRSTMQGGLSAQLVRNRKFAGKPSRIGVAMMWEPYGSKAFYHHAQ